jgi:hypothetical protein
LVQSAIRGEPEAALLWVSRSQRFLARALAERGFSASQKLVGRLLRRLGFSLQANSKTREGAQHLGITSDTAAFAVESIRRWWHELGQSRYPDAKRLLITADCGGSNGPRVRLWKIELQTLADQTGLSITVAHLPPGTSKWNRIEHRLFAFITQNWRGKPLLTHQVIVQLIASTTTQTGLTVQCRLDQNTYEKGVKVSEEQIANLNITPAEFHGEWNYTIAPRNPAI